MVHWLDDVMPLQSGGDQCAVLMRIDTTHGEAGVNGCRSSRPAGGSRKASKVLRWCADHADTLTRHDRCLQVRALELVGRRYDADIEDITLGSR